MRISRQTMAATMRPVAASPSYRALDEKIRKVEKTKFLTEVSKFISTRILPHQAGAEFVDGVKFQAKVLENLHQEN